MTPRSKPPKRKERAVAAKKAAKTARKRPGRKQKDQAEKEAICKKILKEIAKGTPDMYACPIGGVVRETFWRWRQDDPELEMRYRLAEAQAVSNAVGVVEEHISKHKDWKAAMTYLERRTTQFQRHERQSVTHSLSFAELITGSFDDRKLEDADG
jgi:hypothetical protein